MSTTAHTNSDRRQRRVLKADSPRESDYLEALAVVEDVRASLTTARHRLRELAQGVDKGSLPSDSLSGAAAGALDCTIIALYELVEGERSFRRRAQLAKGLWEDVCRNPDNYSIEDGTEH